MALTVNEEKTVEGEVGCTDDLESRRDPLEHATLDPPPVRPGGPAIWLGGQRRRGIPSRRGSPTAGSCPATFRGTSSTSSTVATHCFDFAGQLVVDGDAQGLREARELAIRFVGAGASHLTLGVAVRDGATGLARIAREVAMPVVEAAGRR